MWPFSSQSTTIEVSQPVPEPVQQSVPAQVWTPAFNDESIPTLSDQVQPYTRQPSDRLGLHPALRLLTISFVTFTAGFVLGAADGANTAAFRYRAENAHRLPTSKAGWYLYGKSKGYHTIVGGVTQGVKTGIRFTGWATLFMAIEEGLDRARGRVFANVREKEQGLLAKGQRDFLSTVSAAVTLAGIHSWMNNLDRFAATRMTKLALKFAIPFGLAQDALASFKGERPRYVDWVLGRTLEVSRRENKAWTG
ncbi:hypothetical protein H2198_000367 [Neophaeococcomyces mojaviensis]|uniref:Uncharacterized protein n=1 Tax=Neophaeococcomyces mojaviensis TaxID=3383035 RepID=A0ACC3AJU5_9EURO|nr:hypothetical protein H2198_000367 [Knufia sp. JES_112]